MNKEYSGSIGSRMSAQDALLDIINRNKGETEKLEQLWKWLFNNPKMPEMPIEVEEQLWSIFVRVWK